MSGRGDEATAEAVGGVQGARMGRRFSSDSGDSSSGSDTPMERIHRTQEYEQRRLKTMVAAEHRRHAHGTASVSAGTRQPLLPAAHSTAVEHRVAQPWLDKLRGAVRAGDEILLASELSKFAASCPTQSMLKNRKENFVGSCGKRPAALQVSELSKLLIDAAQKGQLGCVNVLLHHGADVNCASAENCSTPLLEAAKHGHEQCVKALVSAGAKTVVRDKAHGNVLYAAITSGSVPCVDAVLRSPPYVGKDGVTVLAHKLNEQVANGLRPVHAAALHKSFSVLNLMIDHGADLDAATDSQQKFGAAARQVDLEKGHTALTIAAYRGSKECINVLLRAKADMAKKTDSGKTAFHWACAQHKIETMEALLRADCDVNEKDDDGKTGLDLCDKQKEGLESIESENIALNRLKANILATAQKQRSAAEARAKAAEAELLALLQKEEEDVIRRDEKKRIKNKKKKKKTERANKSSRPDSETTANVATHDSADTSDTFIADGLQRGTTQDHLPENERTGINDDAPGMMLNVSQRSSSDSAACRSGDEVQTPTLHHDRNFAGTKSDSETPNYRRSSAAGTDAVLLEPDVPLVPNVQQRGKHDGSGGSGKKPTGTKDSRGADRAAPGRIRSNAPSGRVDRKDHTDRENHMEWVVQFENKDEIDKLRKQVKDANLQNRSLRRQLDSFSSKLDAQRAGVEKTAGNSAVEVQEKKRLEAELLEMQQTLEKEKLAADLHLKSKLELQLQLEELANELNTVKAELESTKAQNAKDRRSLSATAADLRRSKSDLEQKLLVSEERLDEMSRLLPSLRASTNQVWTEEISAETHNSDSVSFGARGRAHANSMILEVHQLVNEWAEQHRPKEPTIMLGQQLARLYIFGSVRLDVDDQGSDVDVLVVVPQHINRVSDIFGLHVSNTMDRGSKSFVEILYKHPEISKVVPIAEAHVPCIKITIGGVDIDLTFANVLHLIGKQAQEKPGQRSWNNDPSEMITDAALSALQHDRQALRSLNGVLVTHAVLRAVSAGKFALFRATLLHVKQWAKARGIYGNADGFLGGISWTLLVAKVCQDATSSMSVAQTIQHFFMTWSKWNWAIPVELKSRSVKGGVFSYTLDMEVWDGRKSPATMAILTPVYPSMNTAHNVSQSAFKIITKELERAAAGICRNPDELGSVESASLTYDRDGDVMTRLWPSVAADIATEFHVKYPCCLQLDVVAAQHVHWKQAAIPRWVELVHASLRHLVRHLENCIQTAADIHLLPRNVLQHQSLQEPHVQSKGTPTQPGCEHRGRTMNESVHTNDLKISPETRREDQEQRQVLSRFSIGLQAARETEHASLSFTLLAICAGFVEQMKGRARQGRWYSEDMDVLASILQT